MNKDRLATLNLHAATALLSLSGILGKLIALSAAAAVCGRSILAAGALYLLVRWRGGTVRLPDRPTYYWLIASGMLLAGHWVTFFLAVRTGTVAAGLLALFTFPVLTAFLEPLVFSERLRGRTILNGLLVLAGLSFVVPEFDLTNNVTIGVLWGLASAVLYMTRNLINRRYVATYGGRVVMFWQVLVAGIVLAPSFAIAPGTFVAIDVLWVLILGLLCTAGAHTMFVSSFRHFRVASASIVLTLEPVYATLIAIPVFGELPDRWTWIGGAIILLAVLHESLTHHTHPPRTTGDAAAT